ncbi:MAG TPA: T9SS type A sorting domain-containing protein [Bacteroidia bacterium]|nr:T9SS type A sorting domain-containing protein [Bacteroidia bacterium]
MKIFTCIASGWIKLNSITAIFILYILWVPGVSRAQNFNYEGLGFTLLSDLTLSGDTLYAATYDGIYKRHVSSGDTTWMAAGLQDTHVVQLLVKDPRTFICVIESGSTGSLLIYKSTNGGTSFVPLLSALSPSVTYLFLDVLAHPPTDFDTLYSLHHRKKTVDGGIYWDTLPANQLADRFIAIDPEHHNRVIIGGETMIFSAYLQISPDHGDTWSFAAMNGYFAGDNCAHDIAFDAGDWFAAGEGVVCKSSDSGNTWTQLLNTWSYPVDFSLYNFDIEISPSDPDRLYMTGTNWSAARVPLFYSQDRGVTWDTLASRPAVSGNPQIVCLTVYKTATGDKVYMGGKGVYSFDNPTSGINGPESIQAIHVFPNPAGTDIRISIPGIDAYDVSVFNTIGSMIYSGANTRRLNTAEWPSGVYLLQVHFGNTTRNFRVFHM